MNMRVCFEESKAWSITASPALFPRDRNRLKLRGCDSSSLQGPLGPPVAQLTLAYASLSLPMHTKHFS